MATLPTIKLDTTVIDLCRQTGVHDVHGNIGVVSCVASSCIALTDDFPCNVRYPYQGYPFTTNRQPDLDGNRKLQSSLAVKYLSTVTQRDAFISGATSVVVFDLAQSEKLK